MFPASIHAGLSSRVVVLVAIFILCAGISAAAQDSPEPDHSAELASVDIYDSALADELSSEQADYGRLAGQAYSSGDFERAAAFYILALKQGSGDNTTQYNLACCYGLLGKAELAARYLQLSVDNGFSDVHGLQNDPDFTLVRDDPQFSWEVAGMVEQIEKRQAAAGQRIFIPAHTWQPAWVTYPDDYDPRQSYRLLVALHGFGSNAESFMGIRERFADADFIMVCPQAPYAFPLGDAVGYSWAGWTMNGGLPPESFADTQAYLDELIGTMQDLADVGVDILTLGQYLQPSKTHLPVARFYKPEAFVELKKIGLDMGFRWVESGPLVRSSYRAEQQVRALSPKYRHAR